MRRHGSVLMWLAVFLILELLFWIVWVLDRPILSAFAS